MMPQETAIAQYVKKIPIVLIEPVGEMHGRKSYVTTENGKFLIISLVQELHDCHQNGKCLPHFDASNVVVTDSGRVKLKGLTWIRKKNEYVRQNYRDVGQILKEIVFRNNWDAVPEDMKHLIDLMLMMPDSDIEMEYVIRTHASLLPIGNRYQFFLQMYEQINYMVSPTVQQHIMNALPYGYDWETRLIGNSLLEESFKFRKYDPRNGPMVFLKYYRNTEAHRMERYGKPLKYTADDFEKILLVTFPLYLPIMQQELAKKKKLRGLEGKNSLLKIRTMPQETAIAQYVKNIPIVLIKPVGEMHGRKSYVTTENGKFIISSLLQELHDCHQNGKCLPHFDASNVVVTDSGRAKLKGLEWKPKKNEFVLQNYRDAGQILKEIVFRNNWGAVPEDMKHLIDLMLMMPDSASEMEYVIRTHASLLPIGNRYQFFLQMYEQINYMVIPTVQQHIMNALPYGYDWETRLKGNSLLEESFNFTTYDPSKGPMVFLKYYRNTEAHRMERYGKPLKYNAGKPLKYTADDFEKILLVTFPLYLPIMQQELAKQKKLRGLKLHRLFPGSK